jgi:poly(A) polymerase
LIGNPLDRINEDKLRLLRVVRFAARFDFTIESETAAAVCLKAQEITQVSAERIANELSKILKTKNKRRAIELLFESHLIYSVLPDIAKMKGVEQPPEFHPEGARVRRICIGLGPFEKLDLNNPEHFDPTKYKMYPGDVLEHTTLTLEKLPEDASIELLWGGLLHDVGKPYTQTFEDRIRFSGHDAVGETKAIEILKGFKFSNVFVEHVASLVKNHMKMAAAERMRTSKLKRFVNLPKFEEHLALHRADCAASHGGFEHWEFLQNKLKEFESMPEKVILDKLPRLVTGHDLIDLGFKQGPVFRTILEAIQDLQLENVITTKEQAINHILTTYAGESNAGNSSSLEKAGC